MTIVSRKDFESMENYLLYPYESFINGNKKQAKIVYNKMVKRGYKVEIEKLMIELFGLDEYFIFIKNLRSIKI